MIDGEHDDVGRIAAELRERHCLVGGAASRNERGEGGECGAPIVMSLRSPSQPCAVCEFR